MGPFSFNSAAKLLAPCALALTSKWVPCAMAQEGVNFLVSFAPSAFAVRIRIATFTELPYQLNMLYGGTATSFAQAESIVPFFENPPIILPNAETLRVQAGELTLPNSNGEFFDFIDLTGFNSDGLFCIQDLFFYAANDEVTVGFENGQSCATVSQEDPVSITLQVNKLLFA